MDEEGLSDAAILLMSLGEEEAAEVFRHLSPKEVQKLGETIAKTRAVSKERVDEVTGIEIGLAHEITDGGGLAIAARADGKVHQRQGFKFLVSSFRF